MTDSQKKQFTRFWAILQETHNLAEEWHDALQEAFYKAMDTQDDDETDVKEPASKKRKTEEKTASKTTSGYLLFVNEKMKSGKHGGANLNILQARKAWLALTDKAQAVYNDRAKQRGI